MTTQSKYRATGRRKSSVARVTLTPGNGKREINGRDFLAYFANQTRVIMIEQPLTVLEAGQKWDVLASAQGGGVTGQAGAVRLGIARALVAFNEENRKPLREHGLLTRDARVVERKKYGKKGARRSFQFSKR